MLRRLLDTVCWAWVDAGHDFGYNATNLGNRWSFQDGYYDEGNLEPVEWTVWYRPLWYMRAQYVIRDVWLLVRGRGPVEEPHSREGFVP